MRKKKLLLSAVCLFTVIIFFLGCDNMAGIKLSPEWQANTDFSFIPVVRENGKYKIVECYRAKHWGPDSYNSFSSNYWPLEVSFSKPIGMRNWWFFKKPCILSSHEGYALICRVYHRKGHLSEWVELNPKIYFIEGGVLRRAIWTNELPVPHLDTLEEPDARILEDIGYRKATPVGQEMKDTDAKNGEGNCEEK